ncbi:MAG: class I SAM-dependent methyltransferase [Candidatus Electrothrix sp. EH2]|nr:class I SAM-dependent methyltransferase [Candidatus Electrothrix sp. EH2]
MIEKILLPVCRFFFIIIGRHNSLSLLNLLIRSNVSLLPSDEALRQVFQLERELYNLEGDLAVKYGNGVHTKHRHLNYHDFFVQNIEPEESVVDLGCGIGAVAFSIAEKRGCLVTGVDLSSDNIDQANKKFQHPNITYLQGDVTDVLPETHYDVVVLSNVLEHLRHRTQFLRKVVQTVKPQKFLIRVPLFERDWRVPLMKELGVDWRLDPTHEIEYTRKDFEQEMLEAGLTILRSEIHWGEIWAVVLPSSSVHSV